MQVVKVELPAVALAAAVLAYQPVQPAFDTAREPEVSPVDGQYQGVVQHTGKEPVRQDQFDTQRHAPGVRTFLPLVDPREAVQSPAGGLADRGRHSGRLQAIQCRLETLVVAQRCAPANKAQDLVRRGLYPPGRPNTRIAGLDNLAGRPDEDVGIPDGGDAVLLRALHADGDLAVAKVDRRGTPRLRQREERVGHQILGVARRHVARQRTEQIELFSLLLRAGHDGSHPRDNAQRPSR